jgi:hypothetical protein
MLPLHHAHMSSVMRTARQGLPCGRLLCGFSLLLPRSLLAGPAHRGRQAGYVPVLIPLR